MFERPTSNAPQEIPQEGFSTRPEESEAESPMEQKLPFSVDIVFNDLTAIIPEYNKFIEDRGNRVPEEMLACQQEALHTMRSIKNGENPPTSKEQLIAELDRREEAEMLSVGVYDLITGIL